MTLGVREHLIEAIRLHLRADGPVGIYLSGGIDSSLVAGIVTHLVKERGITAGSQDPTDRVRCFIIQVPLNPGLTIPVQMVGRTADFLGVSIQKFEMNEARLTPNFADSAYHCEHHNSDLNSVGKFVLSKETRDSDWDISKGEISGEVDSARGGEVFCHEGYLRDEEAPIYGADEVAEGWAAE
ncbi:uncharacterized protein BCR38DRAFT_525143 [Pseudomassariella vexata]|uniref:Asparagine synthetase domain-containing protein n=1 Tax=Pseudomassariella vexata TaxID=1141098 RepID=A0A1Y2DS56_9PEZI|nr:uncharacterized protein BCR38DRAFT_525143 [Pseudomassariella vexata]ORY62077.1 hypothetical protein BCR38DRAFT_525143 [Pseudomassariella vexata]